MWGYNRGMDYEPADLIEPLDEADDLASKVEELENGLWTLRSELKVLATFTIIAVLILAYKVFS